MMAAIEECRDALGLKTIDIFLMHEVRTGTIRGARRRMAGAAGRQSARGWCAPSASPRIMLDVARAMADVSACDVVSRCSITAVWDSLRAGSRYERGYGCRPHSLQGGRQSIYTMKALGGGNLTADYQKALDYVFLHRTV